MQWEAAILLVSTVRSNVGRTGVLELSVMTPGMHGKAISGLLSVLTMLPANKGGRRVCDGVATAKDQHSCVVSICRQWLIQVLYERADLTNQQ